MPQLQHHRSDRLTELDRFLAEVARQQDGLRLHQFVQMALEKGFRGEKTGELTTQVHRSLKKLVRKGIIIRDINKPVVVVA